MLRQRITKSITCIVAIALFAWSLPVAADDAKGSTYGLSPEDILSMVAFDSEDTTYDGGLRREDMLAVARAQILADHAGKGIVQVHLPFELSLYDRWNTSVVAFDSEGSTYGLPPEDVRDDVNWYILSVAHQQHLLNTSSSKATTVARANGAESSVHRYDLLPEHIRDQILTNNMKRMASGVFYDANEKSGYGLLSEQPVDDECDSC